MKRTKAIGCKGLAALVGATVIGVPAATALAGADCSFAVDDGTSETSVGLTDGGLIVGGVPFDADFLGCSQVSQVRVDWGGLAAGPGAPAQIIIQNDPNNDGDPNDITGNLACVDVTVQTAELGTFDVYEIDPPVAVSGIFFVSAAIEHEAGDFPLGLDQDSNNGVAWTNFDVADSCDPWADGAGAPLDGLGIPGNWAIQIGEGAEAGADCPEDIDGDDTVGVPDLLDLLSQWGGPGSADFDGSGDVGVPDLLQLLGAWGECPPGGPQGACGLLTTGDCCSANNSQFCNDQTCCETVCAIDSFSAATADIATDECALCTAPPNDNCDQAQEVGLGMFDYSTINSNTDGNPLPELCALENDTLGFGKDVWFCYTHKDPDGPVTASICDLDYDGRMAVYEDCSACPPPNSNIVGCNDDGCGDVGGGSIVAFNAVQGETYLIRVGGWSPDVPGNASEGSGTLTIELGGTPPNPGGNIFDPIFVSVGQTVGWDSTDNPSSANVPDCGEGLPNGPTVFFQVTGDGTTLTASTCTTALEVDTSMSVVCGEVGQLACVGANDDNFANPDCFDNNAGVGGSEVSWCSEDGQTYIIAVWASNGGVGELSVSSDGTPCDEPVSCVASAACCFSDGSCEELLTTDCEAAGGLPQQGGTDCGDVDCVAGVCGGPEAGDCCEANGSAFCDDAACCNCICACDPFCCDTEWDGFCAGEGFVGNCGASNPNSPCTSECDQCL